MFTFIKRLFGAAKDTAQAVSTPDAAKTMIAEPEPAKKPAAKKRAVAARKTAK